MHANPCGLNGFAFLEFSAPEQTVLHRQFSTMGFTQIATHQTADISLHQQGDIQFIINAMQDSQAAGHAKHHGRRAIPCSRKISARAPRSEVSP